MKTEDILNTMSALDPALIEEAAGKRRRTIRKLPIAIAACLCLILLAAAAAVQTGKIQLTDIGGGYSLRYELETHEIEALGPELQSFYTDAWDPEKFPTYDPQTGNYDGSGWVSSYSTLEEAETFVGVPLRNNPLLREGLKDRVSVDAERWVTISGTSTVEGQDFNWTTDICLKDQGILVGTDVRDENSNFRSEEYQMANGETAIIVYSDSADLYADGVWHASYAYFVADGILYNVAFGDGGILENNEAGMQLLYQVLDAFA